MRRLAAAVVVLVIALFGAVYLSSRDLGGPTVRCLPVVPSIGLGGQPNPCRSGGPALFPHSQASWQIPVSVLIGVLGVVGGLVVLRTRPKQPLGSSKQAA